MNESRIGGQALPFLAPLSPDDSPMVCKKGPLLALMSHAECCPAPWFPSKSHAFCSSRPKSSISSLSPLLIFNLSLTPLVLREAQHAFLTETRLNPQLRWAHLLGTKCHELLYIAGEGPA